MAWSFVIKYAVKGVAKVAAKAGAKSGAKSAGKQIGKRAAKGAAKSITDGWFFKVLDYTDPIYWIWRGIKSVGKKSVAKGVAKGAAKRAAKRGIFKRGIAKLGALGIVGSSLSYAATTIIPDMIWPTLGAAIGTAGALYGAKKIKEISERKEKEKREQEQRDAQDAAQLNANMQRMMQLRRNQMARAA